MDEEIVKAFIGKHVKLEWMNSDHGRPFNLYGEIKQVSNGVVLIYTDRLGAIPLDSVVAISEDPTWGRKKHDY